MVSSFVIAESYIEWLELRTTADKREIKDFPKLPSEVNREGLVWFTLIFEDSPQRQITESLSTTRREFTLQRPRPLSSIQAVTKHPKVKFFTFNTPHLSFITETVQPFSDIIGIAFYRFRKVGGIRRRSH